MSSIFTKTKFILFSVLFLSIISIPALLMYAQYKKYKARKRSGCADLIICDCCGEWKPKSSTAPYIYNNTKYTVCPIGQSTESNNLEFALSKNKYIKLLSPF